MCKRCQSIGFQNKISSVSVSLRVASWGKIEMQNRLYVYSYLLVKVVYAFQNTKNVSAVLYAWASSFCSTLFDF